MLVSCDTDPDRRGPNTDHLPILMQFNMSLAQAEQMSSRNFHKVNWKAFNKTLDKALAKHAPPQLIATKEEFHLYACHLDKALKSMVESCVPMSRPHPHQKRWWTKDLTRLLEELKHMHKLAYKFCAIPSHKCYRLLKEKEKQLDKEIQTAKESH